MKGDEHRGDWTVGDRLFVGVLGNRNSGKSSTWNDIFGATVRRGKYSRLLELRTGECVEVYLVSGSFEERNEYAGDVLDDQAAKIILCSMQYTEDVGKTIDYITKSSFDIFIQWLNPGYNDTDQYFDRLGLVNLLLAKSASLSMRNGKLATTDRVAEIREFIYGWAQFRNLIVPCT
ncbi:hypothetical protein [Bradyrhizobium sp. SZCCHNR2026]|uniref:hypothetical protein n=1 Tax=Bradyrhizobium sp. SZCCHNR2026 TaxID=3057381 RepID=UPI002916E16F|nr:hypothetical protein [Bradyrhizobium sp. SZCCHNR2026]